MSPAQRRNVDLSPDDGMELDIRAVFRSGVWDYVL